jgi:hypothetical protein
MSLTAHLWRGGPEFRLAQIGVVIRSCAGATSATHPRIVGVDVVERRAGEFRTPSPKGEGAGGEVRGNRSQPPTSLVPFVPSTRFQVELDFDVALRVRTPGCCTAVSECVLTKCIGEKRIVVTREPARRRLHSRSRRSCRRRSHETEGEGQ